MQVNYSSEKAFETCVYLSGTLVGKHTSKLLHTTYLLPPGWHRSEIFSTSVSLLLFVQLNSSAIMLVSHELACSVQWV